MSLGTLVASIVGVAKGIVDNGELSTSVTWIPWVGQDGKGRDLFGSPTILKAVVEDYTQQILTPQGQMAMASHKILILEPLNPNGATGRSEPLDGRDQLVISGRPTNSILSIRGAMNGATGKKFYHEVIL